LYYTKILKAMTFPIFDPLGYLRQLDSKYFRRRKEDKELNEAKKYFEKASFDFIYNDDYYKFKYFSKIFKERGQGN